jgi:hypothetical protein
MSQGLTPPARPAGRPPGAQLEQEQPQRIFLVSYPKMIFMYPTLIAALLAGIIMAFAETETPRTYLVSALFMAVFTINLVVFAFDFPRTTSLTLFFFLAAVVMALLLTFRFNDQILPWLHRRLNEFQPFANATFFFSLAGALSVVFIAVLINVQFDYWEVTPNELLHHHGVLSNLERYSSPNLKIDMEINDVFEYFLLRAGRLILHPSTEPRAIVLENVMRIKSKEAQLTKMLGALQVQVRGVPQSDSSTST